MVVEKKIPITSAYRFSIAPMMDYTDRHFRVLMRKISLRSLLYTEMVVAKALHYSQKRSKLLDFDEAEHPIALQIGGDSPELLSEASKMAEDWGYDEINLNIGCPSPRVQSGNFGACLMANDDLVAKCIESMCQASNIPVTVKHRIGIDDLDSYKFLEQFVDRLANAGAQRFAIHARKALLNGLNPKENRTIPPLDYEKVINLKKKRAKLKIELNGGLKSIEECIKALQIFDGVMVGRAIYDHPMKWTNIDELIFQEKKKQCIKASEIIRKLIPYTQTHLDNNGKLWDVSRHILKLVEEVEGARAWRKNLCNKAQKAQADIKILEEAALQLEEAGL